MKLLRHFDHLVLATHYANALRAAGIRCEVRNTALYGAIGDIPWLECSPQVWLHDALDEARAHQLLSDLSSPTDAPAWKCASCSETIEPQFSACWNCGSFRVA